MTDREMLELAARAAGIDVFWWPANPPAALRLKRNNDIWKPLTNDGDALRLAIDLGMEIHALEKCVYVETNPETLLGPSQYSALEMYGDDPYAATRRAIVRVAAEIGKGVK